MVKSIYSSGIPYWIQLLIKSSAEESNHKRRDSFFRSADRGYLLDGFWLIHIPADKYFKESWKKYIRRIDKEILFIVMDRVVQNTQSQ
jgi:hypothetical protein